MTYRLTPDLKEVVQQRTPFVPQSEEEQNDAIYEAQRELPPTMARFPARGFTEKHLGVDLREGEHFIVGKGDPNHNPETCGCENHQDHCPLNPNAVNVPENEKWLVAVAVPATEETISTSLKDAAWEYRRKNPHHNLYQAFIAGASSQKQEIEDLKREVERYKALDKAREDAANDPYWYWPQCDVEGCEGVSCNNGHHWPGEGYWCLCREHSADVRKGLPKPKMKDKAIARENSRDENGYATINDE